MPLFQLFPTLCIFLGKTLFYYVDLPQTCPKTQDTRQTITFQYNELNYSFTCPSISLTQYSYPSTQSHQPYIWKTLYLWLLLQWESVGCVHVWFSNTDLPNQQTHQPHNCQLWTWYIPHLVTMIVGDLLVVLMSGSLTSHRFYPSTQTHQPYIW